jgi:fermentation-respiration switch protein FrsA (DUF1100 family)
MKNLLVIALLAALAGVSPNLVAAPAAPTVHQPSDPAAAANALLDDMDAGRFDAVQARFSSQMALAVSAAQLKAAWLSMPQQFGKFEHRGTAQVEKQGSMTVVIIPLAYEHGALIATIATDTDGKIAGFLLSPAPPPPAATRSDLPSTEVLIGPEHRTGLPGTLLLPKGNGPFPAVVLVQGSGPNDRNETVGGTRVFLDIAEGLADRGIASLRYEKRTRQHPAEFSGAYTVNDETTDDAVAAVALLKTQAHIDPKHIYVVGHSLGAMMAPRIAQRAPGLAGLVLMAAPARHLQYVVLDQFNYLSEHDPAQRAALQTQLPELRRQVQLLVHIDPKLRGDTHMLDNLPASYWRDLANYDPVQVVQTLRLPILLEQGDRDFQVTEPDWTRWQKTFADDSRITIHRYPSLNHLFVPGQGFGLISEYAKPAHVDSKVIADIADWIKAR